MIQPYLKSEFEKKKTKKTRVSSVSNPKAYIASNSFRNISDNIMNNVCYKMGIMCEHSISTFRSTGTVRRENEWSLLWSRRTLRYWLTQAGHNGVCEINAQCTITIRNPWAHFYLHGLTLIPAWTSNYTHYKMWDWITYPFVNFNGATVEV